jgi:hypothetical protein
MGGSSGRRSGDCLARESRSSSRGCPFSVVVEGMIEGDGLRCGMFGRGEMERGGDGGRLEYVVVEVEGGGGGVEKVLEAGGV